MKSSISGIAVFGAASRTHREIRHRRVRSVIRHALNNRETWTAVRAVGERVSETPLCRIENFISTVEACRGIRCDSSSTFIKTTLDDVETIKFGNLQRPCFDRFDFAQRWRLVLDSVEKGLEFFVVSRRRDQHTRAVVADPARQIGFSSKPPDRRPKTDSLHKPGYSNLYRLPLARLRLLTRAQLSWAVDLPRCIWNCGLLTTVSNNT